MIGIGIHHRSDDSEPCKVHCVAKVDGLTSGYVNDCLGSEQWAKDVWLLHRQVIVPRRNI